MVRSSVRRPLPALIFLVALALVSGLVWWRVLHRDSSSASGSTGASTSSTCRTSKAPAITLPQPGAVTVTVLNATTTTGLAEQVTNQFKDRGFQVGAYGNDDPRLGATTTEVRYGPQAAAGAKLVQIFLPGSQLVPTQSTDAGVTVSLGSSFTALATPAQVSAAQATATAVPTC